MWTQGKYQRIQEKDIQKRHMILQTFFFSLLYLRIKEFTHLNTFQNIYLLKFNKEKTTIFKNLFF